MLRNKFISAALCAALAFSLAGCMEQALSLIHIFHGSSPFHARSPARRWAACWGVKSSTQSFSVGKSWYRGSRWRLRSSTSQVRRPAATSLPMRACSVSAVASKDKMCIRDRTMTSR